MAGVAAELINCKNVDRSYREGVFRSYGADDLAKIEEYICFVSGLSPNTFMDRGNIGEVYDDLFEKYWGETVNIINDNSQAIMGLRDYVVSRLNSDENVNRFFTEELLSHVKGILSSKNRQL
ncbi:hypothetical protein PSGK_30105 [Pseudomonas solani]|uniref:hypothetical protein n=1 Tax=Pseudomonas solani TaxID=2731552 RepID=UPI0035BE21E4